MRHFLIVSFVTLTLVTGVGMFGTAPAAHAQVGLINPLAAGNCNSTNTDCLGAFLQNILAFVVRIGSVIVILMLVYVGFKFVTAQGNDAKITEAKTMLLWTVIGALVLLGAQAIALAIQATAQSLGA
jgi:heme/copper-type cytochrome/quinol oxidase subunit 2